MSYPIINTFWASVYNLQPMTSKHKYAEDEGEEKGREEEREEGRKRVGKSTGYVYHLSTWEAEADGPR